MQHSRVYWIPCFSLSPRSLPSMSGNILKGLKMFGFISVQRHEGGCQGFNTQVQSGARDARFPAEETANLPSDAWQEWGVQSMNPAPCSLWQPGFDYSRSRSKPAGHEAVTMGECAN